MPRRYLQVVEQQEIIERANSRCEYCQSWVDFSTQSFEFEHIIPVSLDGETELDNLAFACGGCNGHKHTRIESVDPVSQQTVPLYNPRKQQWFEHFAWSDDYLLLIGITAIGRATENALCMNRQGVVNLRRLLHHAGLHPPSD